MLDRVEDTMRELNVARSVVQQSDGMRKIFLALALPGGTYVIKITRTNIRVYRAASMMYLTQTCTAAVKFLITAGDLVRANAGRPRSEGTRAQVDKNTYVGTLSPQVTSAVVLL